MKPRSHNIGLTIPGKLLALPGHPQKTFWTQQGFIKIGDDKEEIMKLFEEKYMWKPNTLGITEESYDLLEVNAKIISTDRDLMGDKNGN